MNFCTQCGRTVAPGTVCVCQQPVQYQQPQYQQPQQPAPPPYQQPPQYPQPPQYQNPQYPQYPQQYPGMSGKLPGQTMIRVSGILLTIFGAIAMFITIAAFGLLETANNYTYGVARAVVSDSLQYLLVFEIIMAICTCVFGIVGIALASERGKGGLFIGLGVSLIGLRLIDFIWGVSAYGDHLGGSLYFGAAVGLVLPILYIVGGNKLRKA